MSLNIPAELTTEQLHHFRTNGYLKLPQLLSEELLSGLQNATDRLIAQGNAIPESAVITASNNQQYVIGIEKLVAQPEPVFAQLLGSPLLLSIAQTICGSDFFPVQDFLVNKTLGDDNHVMWHQDILTQPLSKTIMIGFYLDAANDENGALRIIPGSHKSNLPICELEKMEYTSIEMEAGDVLVHDLMLAHSSGRLTDFQRRRVVYFEFMSGEQALSENIYPEAFIEHRQDLIRQAIGCFNSAFPNTPGFEWQHPNAEKFFLSEDPAARILEICSIQRTAHVANYCFDQLQAR